MDLYDAIHHSLIIMLIKYDKYKIHEQIGLFNNMKVGDLRLFLSFSSDEEHQD